MNVKWIILLTLGVCLAQPSSGFLSSVISALTGGSDPCDNNPCDTQDSSATCAVVSNGTEYHCTCSDVVWQGRDCTEIALSNVEKGCYKKENGVHNDDAGSSISPAYCLNYCYFQKSETAFALRKEKCYCEDEAKLTTEGVATPCDVVCTGDTSAICGNDDNWNVHNIVLDPDDCAAVTCLNDGTCYDKVGGFGCICSFGFTGTTCAESVDDCAQAQCLNGGNCTDGLNSYTCNCPTGFNGSHCEMDINECHDVTCQNNGTCQDYPGFYKCDCLTAYTGQDCESDFNECDSNPCQHNATCNNLFDHYTCDCHSGYNGTQCEHDIDDCLSRPCSNGGNCTDLIDFYYCTCPVDRAGTHCENINECASNPCSNNATCEDLNLNYTCQCAAGWNGTHCEIEINECDVVTCQQNGTCNDYVGYYWCDCPIGFKGQDCQENIDDCASDPCSNNGTCHDEVNQYVCECVPGFNMTHCQHEIDECESSPCSAATNATCHDFVNYFMCECLPGYNGTLCENEVMECDSLPCSSGQSAGCVDLIDDYYCTCVAGFTDKECATNIDECVSYPCSNNGTCDDRVNGYLCNCTAGFEGDHCELDIDECQFPNGTEVDGVFVKAGPAIECVNNGTCIDFVAGFWCDCSPGYNGTYCEFDIDECESGPCSNNASCVTWSVIPDFYNCTCWPGYNGTHCEFEIDECESDPCTNGTCVDLVDMYYCRCIAGWSGTHCEFEIDECGSDPCHFNGTCHDYLDAYACTCHNGTSGFSCEENIDECASDPCQNNGTCTDWINFYVCDCIPEYTDRHCSLLTRVWEIAQMYSAVLDLSILTDIVSQSSVIIDAIPFVVGTFNESTQFQLSWTLSDVFQYCTFEGIECDMENDWYAWVDPSLGTCYTYNHEKTTFRYKVRRVGEPNGLKLYLYLGQSDFVPWQDVAGYKIYIHNQSDSVFQESVGYSTPAGFDTNFGLVYTENRRLSGKYGDCLDSTEGLSKYYYDGTKYSKEACLRSCFQYEVNEQCGCVDPRYVIPDGMEKCTLASRDCVNEFIAAMGDPSTWPVCSCPLPCNGGEYTVSISRTKYVDNPPHCMGVPAVNLTYCQNEFRREHVRVGIYFEQIASTVYQENPAYELMNLLSDMGGQLGIIAGVSGISIAEFILMIFRMCFAFCTGKG